jgi:hypothetical protein
VARAFPRRSLLLCLTAAWLAWAPTTRGEEIPPRPVDGDIAWVYRYDEGKKLARETGKPLFVVFRCER